MLSITEPSCSPLMKLRISTAARTPPSDDFLMFSLPDSSFVNTSLSSRKAAGCTPSRVAMRSTTSLRKRSVKWPRISQAWSRSRWTRMVAMICGCSLRISSATDCASIHFRLSIPLASRPPRILLSREVALSSPSALVSTLRMYSSESRPSEDAWPVSPTNSISTSLMASKLMFFMADMAAPSFCTSRGPRYFMTSAASSSPSASIRMAPFSTPSLLIVHPCLNDACHQFRIILGPLLGGLKIGLVSSALVEFAGFAREVDHGIRIVRIVHGSSSSSGFGGFCFRTGLGFFLFLAGDLPDNRTQNTEVEVEQHRGQQDVFADFLGQLDHVRLLPQRQFRLCIAVELRIDNIERVAAILVVAHRLFHQISNLTTFGFGQRLHDDLTGLVNCALVIDDDGNGQALHTAHRLLHVTYGLVDFVVDRSVFMRRAIGGGWGCCSSPGSARCCAGNRRIGDWGCGRSRRLIGQCARNAGSARATVLRFAALLAAYGGGIDSLIRLVGFGGLFAAREIDVCRCFSTHVAVADDRGDDRFDALDDVLLQILHIFQLGWVQAVTGLLGRRVGEQVAVLVNNGDGLGRQFGDAAGHQMHDGADLLGIQHATRVEAQNDRCSRLLLIADENRGFGQGQMDAGRLYCRQGLDRARQFTFESALEIDLLQKLGNPEFLVFHQFEADIATLGQALCGQLQAR